MRSALYSFATLLLLAVGFFFYWRAQPAVSHSVFEPPATSPSTKPSDQMQMNVGPGENPWVNSFDDKGKLVTQFKAAEYLPQKDRSFKVLRPVAVFYLDDGQFLAVAGETGVVFVDAATGSASATAMQMNAPPMQAPNNGILHQVHVALFASTKADKPTLWLDVNNLSFDNDTLRLYTQSYLDETGATIPADRVPVTVRGDDYEFDGTGLTINWNDRDHHLQLLEVAHGGRLQIKNPGTMSVPWSSKSRIARGRQPLPEALAAADPMAAALVIAPPAAPRAVPATSSAPKLPYRAVFNDSVRIEQGNRQLAVADTMTVDFLPGSSKRPDAKRPAATAPAAPALDRSSAPPAAEKLAGAPAAIASPKAPATAPTTRELPITVYWTGKLRITPLETSPVLPLVSGQAAVRLVGSPVELTPEATIVHAAAVTYRTDGAVRLEGSTALPLVELMQQKGLTFTSEGFDYDPVTELATITGRSDMHLPLEGRREQLTASWTRKGVMHFVGKAAQPESVDRIDLTGRVNVDHPDFNIKSNRLVLELEKPPARTGAANAGPTTKSAGGAVIKRATATGDVICRLVHGGLSDRGIDADQLVMETAVMPGGKRMPRSATADGNVRAFDPTQRLEAGHLETLLVPKLKAKSTGLTVAPAATKVSQDGGEEVEVESLLAKTNVRALLKSGAVASADELRVVTKSGKPEVELRGLGAVAATITDGKGGLLSGPVLHVSPERSLVTVDGAGEMRTLRRSAPGATSQPMAVTWTDSLTVDAPGNTVDAIGTVTVKMTDSDGAVSSLSSDRAHLDLMDVKRVNTTKPAVAPATQTASTKGSELGDKDLRAMLLQGRVRGESLLTAPNGDILRRGTLSGERLTYDAATGRTEIPGPGWLVMEDHRKPTTAPSRAAGGGENRGSLSASWNNRLVYDEAAHQVVLDGAAHVGFRKEEKDASPMLLTSERVIVDMVPPPTTREVRPTSKPTTSPASPTKMQIAHVRAEGGVEFKVEGKDVRFHAHQIDYDPAKQRLIARGTVDDPAYMENEQGLAKDTFDELIFDTQRQEVESVKGMRGAVRR